MNVRYTRQALADLDSALTWISVEQPGAAETIGKCIRDAVDGLRDFPEKGRPGRVHGTRELIFPATPFVVPYRVGAQHVDVLAVLHGARRWPPGFG